jgi:hypothetical protein
MEIQKTNGASDTVVVDAVAVEDAVPVSSTELARRTRRSEVLHPLDREQLVASFREYQELCRELLDETDYQEYSQRAKVGGRWQDVRRRFKKKSAWRKLAAAFDLDVRVVGEVRIERDIDGKPVRAAALARAIAPSGRYMEGTGYCSIDEPRFRDDRSKAENDLPATSETRAKNRAIADLLGTGEVSAEEVSAGHDGEGDQNGPAFGPVVTAEGNAQATKAAVRICGGDRACAKAMWDRIQAALDGYMPQAAATALVHAAASLPAPADASDEASVPERVSTGAGRQGEPASAQPPAEAEQPVREGSAENPHASRLLATARGRGIGDAELANLIRSAAGAVQVTPERAVAQLDVLLAQVTTEEIAGQALELIEMLHPASEHTASTADADTVSVDFGAFEPGECEGT